MVLGGKALSFTDPQKLQQFIAKREGKGQRQNAQMAWVGSAAEEMDQNVCGLNDKRKIRKVVAYLRRYAVDEAILQETQVAPGDKDTVQQRMQRLDNNGELWSDAASVVKFHYYYMDLYKSCSQFDEAAVTDYLSHIAMSWLIDDHRERLMAPLRP
ncbi:hypothetical protein NDU88_000835 [Pleurodeles waltl]|uniref:Uncharacterized protein n=1 Tax=Pleurodeles waltl TaxID=8319 RepID=A0AAV7Q827_PLEWA|nr:hypothetical protein NDU88_000835 [Pleurodeles waltl]